jgi:hypothetical protein
MVHSFIILSDIQISEITHTIIGGQPDSLIWLEKGFKMDIFPDSFPPDVPVDITISTHQTGLSYSKHKLVTQMYTITSTTPSSGIVLVHLKHNLVFNDTDHCLPLIFEHNTELLPLQNLSKYFMSSKVSLEYGYNNISGVIDHNYATALAKSKILHAYSISFYTQELFNSLIFFVVLTFPGDKLITSLYSGWMKDPNSPYEVLMINGSTILTLEPSGCWDKLESENYTEVITKEYIYYYNLQWKCSWWPLDTLITVNRSYSEMNVSISTDAESGYIAIFHFHRDIVKKPIVALLNKITMTIFLQWIYVLRYFYYKDMNLIDLASKSSFTILCIWLAEIFFFLKNIMTTYFH